MSESLAAALASFIVAAGAYLFGRRRVMQDGGMAPSTTGTRSIPVTVSASIPRVRGPIPSATAKAPRDLATVLPGSNAPLDQADLDLMARTIWGEARNEPKEGLDAVAHVILNRVHSARYPSTIRKVILQPWQFSMWNPGDVNGQRALAVHRTESRFRKCQAAAGRAMGGLSTDPTGGALHYATTNRPPNVSTWPPRWAGSSTGSVVIGAHTFYRGVA